MDKLPAKVHPGKPGYRPRAHSQIACSHGAAKAQRADEQWPAWPFRCANLPSEPAMTLTERVRNSIPPQPNLRRVSLRTKLVASVLILVFAALSLISLVS